MALLSEVLINKLKCMHSRSEAMVMLQRFMSMVFCMMKKRLTDFVKKDK